MATAPHRKKYLEQRQGERGEKPARIAAPFGWLILFGVVAVAAFSLVTGLVVFPRIESIPILAGPPAPPAASTVLESALGVPFLSYRHPSYGFAVKYPAGYFVTDSAVSGEAVRFSAFTADGFPLVVRFIVSNESFGERDFADFLSSIPAQDRGTTFTLVSSGKTAVGGRAVYVANLTQAMPQLGEKLLVSYSFFKCPAYAVMMESAVPESSKNERVVFHSMLESFEC